ncbi:hypothetical protein Cst_c09520 [Thermoclostridium stercorarium subsp. stercorarium DSM 8532]|uniref:Uncharacterized protein n=1 Tax=Thermoclostridium stercorarium (strain ATCC 35414 / DSM 8532 / NCIMB 11754) TaxID=1121335 RepID=L7VIQ5_THES1|nr:hypothetical protein Cst_c09520 [Thermoclostridium stercorarium subsp. stercorarium DSM 8532]
MPKTPEPPAFQPAAGNVSGVWSVMLLTPPELTPYVRLK